MSNKMLDKLARSAGGRDSVSQQRRVCARAPLIYDVCDAQRQSRVARASLARANRRVWFGVLWGVMML